MNQEGTLQFYRVSHLFKKRQRIFQIRFCISSSFYFSGEIERGADAEADLENALSLFEEMGDTVELERSLLVHLRLLQAQGRSGEASAVENRINQLQRRVDL